jgi:C-terminal processing protease CtpA/Prc
MKKMAGLLLAAILMFSLIAGCRTIMPKTDLWPTVPANTYLWYAPEKIASTEEAAANLKNLQNSVFFAGMNASEIEVDKYGMRAKLKWTESTYEKFANDTYSYTWWGLMNFVPSATTYQTYKETLQKERTVIIPFKEVADIFMDKDNGVYIAQKNGLVTQTKAANAYDAKQLADSIYTLSIGTFGGELEARTGLSLKELSAGQKRELNLSHGGLVVHVYDQGPGFRSGVKPLDIVTEIDGQVLSDSAQTLQVIKALPFGKEVKVKFLRWTYTGNNAEIEEFETKIKLEKR